MSVSTRIATLAAAAALAFGLAVSGEAQRVSNQAEEDAIRKVVTEMTDGFYSHDRHAASRMYAPDARLVTVRGEVMKNQAEIEKGLSSIFATRARNATHRTLDVAIKFVRTEVAIVHVTNERGLVAPDGQALPSHHELSLRVFTKDNGQWRVAAFHNKMIRPFDAVQK